MGHQPGVDPHRPLPHVLHPVGLHHLHHQREQFQPSKPLPDTRPGTDILLINILLYLSCSPRSVTKGNVCEGVRVVSLLVAPEPALGYKLLRLGEHLWVHLGEGAGPDHDRAGGDEEPADHHVPLIHPDQEKCRR